MRIAIAVLIGVVMAIAAGTLYYWRASQPYLAEARRLAAESEQDLASMAKMKDFGTADYRMYREKILDRERQYRQVEAMRQQVRTRARIVAAVSGIVAFAGSVVVSRRVRRRRKQPATD
ncbi:MAG: hypothetical protein AABM67_10765 [Acidobacteriota bacterium]